MIRLVLRRAESLVLDHPRAVLTVALALGAISIWLGTGIELLTSRQELVPEDDVSQARWNSLRSQFASAEPLIIALEASASGVSVEDLETTAREIAEHLQADPQVRSVFYRVDFDWLADHALALAPADMVEQAFEMVQRLLAVDGKLILTSWADLNLRSATDIEDSLESGSVLPSDDAAVAAAWLLDLVDAERDFLTDPHGFVDRLKQVPLMLIDSGRRGSLTGDGYLSTSDERVVFVLVSPAYFDDSLEAQRALVDSVRVAVAAVLSERAGVRYGLTGPAAMAVEEMNAIGRDTRRTSLIAIVGVLGISLLVFRRRRHALLGLATLAAGVTWSIGAVQLEIGSLNIITTALIPILVGMGIDYAVHPLSQYELERQNKGRREAVRATLRTTSAAVVASAFTTSAAFACLLLMDFRGFSQLGLVTSVGVLLCLLAALLVLPALLLLRGAPEHDNAAARAAVDQIWDDRAARWVCASPGLVVALAIGLTAIAGLAASRVELEPSLLELLPAGSESIHYLEIINDESALSHDFNLVVAEDLEQLRALRSRAEDEASIRRFESILTFLPDQPLASEAAAARARRTLEVIELTVAAFDGRRLSDSLLRLESALATAADDAFVAGLGGVSGALEKARQATAGAIELAMAASPERLAEWAEAQEALRVVAFSALQQLRDAASVPLPTRASLPSEIVDRFMTEDGRYVGYLFPAGDIYDTGFLGQFNVASRRVASNAIGFPVLFESHSALITSGFGLAFASAALLVFLVLLLDLRNTQHTALALVPVFFGTVWMLGLMWALGLSFNFANLVAVPIVLGVGIDAGVHIIHRLRLEGSAGIMTVVSHTGRAILIASLTTMVGFGSLVFATHRGMASLGALLLLGVGACTIAALIVLPNLLIVSGIARR